MDGTYDHRPRGFKGMRHLYNDERNGECRSKVQSRIE